MKLLADESVDGPIVIRLRRLGHDVAYVAEWSPGATDDEVFRYASEQGALFLTADKDFGEMVFRLGKVHRGIVLLRLSGLRVEAKVVTVESAFRDHYEIIGDGHGVHWPDIDEDISAEGMLYGVPARRPKRP